MPPYSFQWILFSRGLLFIVDFQFALANMIWSLASSIISEMDWCILRPYILIRQMLIHLTWPILIGQASNLITTIMIKRRNQFTLPYEKFKSYHGKIFKRFIMVIEMSWFENEWALLIMVTSTMAIKMPYHIVMNGHSW